MQWLMQEELFGMVQNRMKIVFGEDIVKKVLCVVEDVYFIDKKIRIIMFFVDVRVVYVELYRLFYFEYFYDYCYVIQNFFCMLIRRFCKFIFL